ncbi:iron-sulfur cluster repair di-iron protein, ric [Lentibacillus cibarius]|uniref:Iron-sulfur cluster repair di-iron protein, ric n=1 Tax=Lentibacillus cibarius TaxID=2583219 RepID=A0A549YGE7_9BACI|nr:iron-sulfur cluster repair di-iron protein, ric [Lentibacillus cibarius]TRM10970.1 iron-sulfur cluster repair di-iron protein, ric [Lentibacillus cibarius]
MSKSFHEVVDHHFEQLDLFTTAITRVHGKNHPEVFEVRELFETINSKVKEAGTSKPDLDEEFAEMRRITNRYTIPGDVCETYAGVYNMLSEADQTYHAS